MPLQNSTPTETRRPGNSGAAESLSFARYLLSDRDATRYAYLTAEESQPETDDPVAWWQWVHDSDRVPREALVRRFDMQAVKPVYIDRRELNQIRETVEAESVGWAMRCEWEAKLADRLSDVGTRAGRPDMVEKARNMHDCHQSGPIVSLGDGRGHVAWRFKCEQVRLCPHASREELMRLSEAYVPHMMDLVQSSPLHRAYFISFEPPNYAAGSLAFGKRDIYKKWRRWLEKHSNVIAAFVVQEDPLGRDGSWNVHLHAVVIVKGDFSYKRAAEIAGHRVNISQVKDTSAKGLASMMRECVKYAAKPCATSEADKADDSDRAPFMVEYPPERLIEWFDAQKAFRRTRSYGQLYAVDGKRWDAANLDQRIAWALDARTHDTFFEPGDVYDLPWSALSEADREALRRAMRRGERVDISQGWGVGTVEYDASQGRFIVTLQPGDKSPQNPREKTTFFPAVQATGPPRYGGTQHAR